MHKGRTYPQVLPIGVAVDCVFNRRSPVYYRFQIECVYFGAIVFFTDDAQASAFVDQSIPVVNWSGTASAGIFSMAYSLTQSPQPAGPGMVWQLDLVDQFLNTWVYRSDTKGETWAWSTGGLVSFGTGGTLPFFNKVSGPAVMTDLQHFGTAIDWHHAP